jgi:hypothetical protein
MVVVAEECTEDSVMSKMLPSDFCDVEGTSSVCQRKELEEGGLSFFTCVLLRGLLRHSGFQPFEPSNSQSSHLETSTLRDELLGTSLLDFITREK